MMKTLKLKRISAGQYESLDGRYEVAYDFYWLQGECECAICQSGASGCRNDGFGKREGWHIWDRQEDDYALFAHEPQAFQSFSEAKAALAEHYSESKENA